MDVAVYSDRIARNKDVSDANIMDSKHDHVGSSMSLAVLDKTPSLQPEPGQNEGLINPKILPTANGVIKKVAGIIQLGGVRSKVHGTSGLSNDDMNQSLTPVTISLIVGAKEQIWSKRLQLVLSDRVTLPCAILRNFSNVLGLNLDLFSTKTMKKVAPGYEIDVITEKQDVVEDVIGWQYQTETSCEHLADFAAYQTDVIRAQINDLSEDAASGKMETLKTPVKTGIDIDLHDPAVWSSQVTELAKLPPFLHFNTHRNLLSYLGNTVLGVNSVQLSMSVPGSRISPRQGKMNFCTANLSTGPGACQWFCVPYEYWGVLWNLCEKNNVSFYSHSWWPDLTQLRAAKVPVHCFKQLPGDLVWINSGAVYWMKAEGVCSNISWHVGARTKEQYCVSMEEFSWNKLQNVPSVVPMVQLSWAMVISLMAEVPVDEQLLKLVRVTLCQSVMECREAFEYLKTKECAFVHVERTRKEMAHSCCDCQAEIFNIHFYLPHPEGANEGNLRCFHCACEIDPSLRTFGVWHHFSLEEVEETYAQAC